MIPLTHPQAIVEAVRAEARSDDTWGKGGSSSCGSYCS